MTQNTTRDLGTRAVELTAELVAIDSVNPALAAGGAGETAIAALLSDRLASAGFTVHAVPAEPSGRPSLVAVREGSARGPSVVLNGHLDTVPVEGMDAPFTPHIVDGRMLGRGTSDMKGGIAGLVVAAEELAARDVPGRVIVALVADEEGGSVGAEAVLRGIHSLVGLPDVCLIAEPTWLDIAVAHRGFELLRVGVRGRAAHSSQPGEGRDVIPVVGDILAAITERDAALAAAGADPELERGSLMASVVRAGSSPFTIAAEAELLVERRTLPSEPADSGFVELEAILENLPARDGIGSAVESVTRRGAWQLASTGHSATLAQLLAEALAQDGVVAGRRGFPYWMESALWEEAGVPTVVCGPAGGGLHAVDEWVDVEQLRRFPTAVVEAVARFAAATVEGDERTAG